MCADQKLHTWMHNSSPWAFAECCETFATFAFTALCASLCVCVLECLWVCMCGNGRSAWLVVGKVCKGSQLAVFLFFVSCFSVVFFFLGSKWMSQFILRYSASQVERAMQKGLRAWVNIQIQLRRRRGQFAGAGRGEKCKRRRTVFAARHHYNLLICFVKQQTTVEKKKQNKKERKRRAKG